MGFYTKNYLVSLSDSFSTTIEFRNIVNKNKARNQFDIFLSHSYGDKKYIKGLFYELTKMGFSVYVDWIIDPDLQRDNVTEEAANRIRSRMKQCKSLLYATSEDASTSKWMPWELGCMDGDTGKCAILPITDYEDDTFKGQEFLSIYLQVKKDGLKAGYDKRRLEIHKGAHRNEVMINWLNTQI